MAIIGDIYVLTESASVTNGHVLGGHDTCIPTNVDVISKHKSRVEVLAGVLLNCTQPRILVYDGAIA
jgi:hypothetical protein